jgi:hypothetical protein
MGILWLLIGIYILASIFSALILTLACVVGTRADKIRYGDKFQDLITLNDMPILLHESTTFEVLYPAK